MPVYSPVMYGAPAPPKMNGESSTRGRSRNLKKGGGGGESGGIFLKKKRGGGGLTTYSGAICIAKKQNNLKKGEGSGHPGHHSLARMF